MVFSFCRFIASACGIGYLPFAPGTWAAAITTLVCYFVSIHFTFLNLWLPVIGLILVFTGVYCSGKITSDKEKDPSFVVIDEVAGMTISLIFIPVTIQFYIAGFILFRFFDILKPLGIRRMEKLRKGWGIMFDDVLAGIYTLIFLQVLVFINVW
jgi:phosphatidylglycerophosphatase A